MVIFVRDSNGTLLHPTRKQDMVRRWLRNKTARIVKVISKKNGIILVDVNKVFDTSKTIDCEFRIGIDPGIANVGFSLYKIFNNKLILIFSGECYTRSSEITKILLERKMYRNLRRRNRRKNVLRKFGSVKFRHPRWKNRSLKKKEFTPTHRHIITTHFNVINKILNLVPNDNIKIHLEYAKIDFQKLDKPNIKSWQYQRGDMYGYYNFQAYIFARDNYTCYFDTKTCSKNLHCHRIVWGSDGGRYTKDNCTTVCERCHEDIHTGKKSITSNKTNTKNKRQLGLLNSIIPYLYDSLSEHFPIQDTYGYITKSIRLSWNQEKTHEIDANIIALSDSVGLQDIGNYDFINYNNSIIMRQFRRHNRAWIKRIEDRKYYDEDNKLVCNNRRARTGQTKDSLQDIRYLYCDWKLKAKPGRVIYRKSNTKRLVIPGDTIVVDNNWYPCKGLASTQGRIGLYNHNPEYIKKSLCKKILNNSGLAIS